MKDTMVKIYWQGNEWVSNNKVVAMVAFLALLPLIIFCLVFAVLFIAGVMSLVVVAAFIAIVVDKVNAILATTNKKPKSASVVYEKVEVVEKTDDVK